jgi:hypothetical protein
LARESTANKVNWFGFPEINLSHVSVQIDGRPVLFKDSSAILIVFYLPDNLHPGPLKAQVQAPDAGK